MKLTGTYRDLLARELPWLPALLPDYLEEFNMKIIDLDTLGLSPRDNGFWISYKQFGTILVIDENGQVLGNVGQRPFPPKLPISLGWQRWNRFVDSLFGPEEEGTVDKFPETVEQALTRLSGTEKTRFFLQLGTDLSVYNAVLHKLPRTASSMQEWLEQKSVIATVEFQTFLEQ